MRATCVAVATVLAATVCLAACGRETAEEADEPPPAVDVAAHRAEVEAWRADRDARLRQPDGWLSLVGLHWLEEGESTLGSAADAAVRFPPAAPAEAGVLRLAGGRVELTPAPGVAMTVAGEPVAGPIELATDVPGPPTEVAMGSFRFHAIDREGRLGLRVKDAESATLAGFAGMESWPVDPAWRKVARFVPYEDGRTMTVPNVTGDPTEEPCPGAVEFAVDGATHRIDAIGSGDELFLVFGDATNGDETYGGGRFLYTALADADGRVVVDFNKAYNPPCVFTPYATCPLPPPQNRLAVAVRAGEKAYAAAAHH